MTASYKAAKESRPSVTTVQFEDYKGHPLIVLPNPSDPKDPLKLGVRKCHTIVQNIEAIKAFAEKHPIKTPVSVSQEDALKALSSLPAEEIAKLLAGMSK